MMPLAGRLVLAVTATFGLMVAQCDPPHRGAGPAPVQPPRDTRPPVSPSTVLVVVAPPPTAPATTITTTTSGVVGVWQHPVPAVERWHQAALDAGWPETDWPRVACIINRESGGDPMAHNPRDPGLGSYGLMQLNLSLGSSGTWALWGPSLGWDAGRLFDGPTNLQYGRQLFERAQRMWGAGWRPWNGEGCR